MTSGAGVATADRDRRAAGSWVRRWWPFALVAAVYATVALHQITLSGVYMDEVDPDYFVVRLLNWSGPPVPAWLLPGNYPFERFPILVSLQHGTQTLWLGLPAFWLFGTTVAGLRITHALFALGILAAMYAALGTGGVRRWWAVPACAALAVDPAFVYAFRTQSYLTLAPMAWVFLSVLCLDRAAQRRSDTDRRWIAASGFFLGFAFAGYFVYLFFAPAVALAVLLRTGGTDERAARWKHLVCWCAGFAVATLPYLLGYGLLARSQGGLAAGWKYIIETQSQLGAQVGPLTLEGRYAHFRMLVDLVFSNAANHWLMFGEPVPAVGAGFKMALLLAAPVALWLYAEWRRASTPMLRILLGMQLTFVAGVLVFGGRLAGHHYTPLVPLAYATLAVALSAVTVAVATVPLRWLCMLPFAALFGLNVAGDVSEAATLKRTGGVGMYSDAINRLADDLLRDRQSEFLIFPDWGLFMPQAFLTGGKLEMSTFEDFPQARSLLCAGRDVTVALITGDRAARFADWQRQLGWGAPVIKDYRQRDGAVVFALGTFSGRDAKQWCTTPSAPSPATK